MIKFLFKQIFYMFIWLFIFSIKINEETKLFDYMNKNIMQSFYEVDIQSDLVNIFNKIKIIFKTNYDKLIREKMNKEVEIEYSQMAK